MDYRQRKEQERLAARQRMVQFDAALAQGRVVALDVLSRPIAAGDRVTITGVPQAALFRVVDVEPILADPRLAGMINVRLIADLNLQIPSGQPAAGMAIVEYAEQGIAAAVAAGELSVDQAADAQRQAEAADAGASQGISPIVLTDEQH